jgi:hypothetical protein
MKSLDLKVWYVVRCNSKRGPQLRWLAVRRTTAKMVFLAEPAHGRVAVRRLDLRKMGLYESPIEAVLAFGECAKMWRTIAREDARRAERDLDFVNRRPLQSIIAHSREGSL